ncbi:MAG: SPOR domain-containing protein [Bacteroidetes bacterium]|nr:SPOR domain-containing protein [Bacteroidota bacterium]
MKTSNLLLTVLFLLFLIPETCLGQYSMKSQDSLVKVLMNRHIAINQSKKTMPGYRVQIFFGPQRLKANEVKTDFLQIYPNVGSYLVYHQPNFKIRVGDFKTRLEAMKFLKELQPIYATAFLVKDEVKLPEF